MKTLSAVLLSGIVAVTASTFAQPATPSGPRFDAALSKLFGDNQSFTANMQMETKDSGNGTPATIPGKLTFDTGKSRFELDITQLKSSQLKPETAAQIKQFGMDKMVFIERPDKKVSDVVYAGLQSYVETPASASQATAPAGDLKVEVTEQGKETVDGHPCIKNKAVVTEKDGNKHEYLVWNATDQKNFPLRIEMLDKGSEGTVNFKDVSFSKPAASLFEPPSDYTKYDDAMTMMREQVMKRAMSGFGR